MKTKKIGQVFIILIVLVIVVFVCYKLNIFGNRIVKLQAKDINTERYVTVANDSSQELYTSFTDDNYNYYVFYLGCVKLTPISYIDSEYFNGSIPITLQYTEENTSESQIETSSTACISQTVSNEFTASASANLKAKLPYGLKLSVNAGISDTYSRLSTNSTTNTYTSASSFLSTHKKTITYKIDNPCPVGFYRYTLCANCDVYAVVYYDLNTGEKGYDFINCAREDTYGYIIDYSENGDFSKNSTNPNLKFNWSWLDGVDFEAPLMNKVDVKKVEELKHTVELPNNVTILNDSNKKKIEAAGTILNKDESTDWGLSRNNPDRLNLIEYYDYMTDAYDWYFTVEIGIKEIDDGYQEVYLYNEFVAKKEDTYSKNTALSNGLLQYDQAISTGGSGKGSGTFNKTWVVSGADCRTEMYIRYGAHGKNSDDWYRLNIKVNLTIKEKNANIH